MLMTSVCTTCVHPPAQAAAIACLGRCIRPLLLSGWGTDEETGPQVGGCTRCASRKDF